MTMIETTPRPRPPVLDQLAKLLGHEPSAGEYLVAQDAIAQGDNPPHHSVIGFVEYLVGEGLFDISAAEYLAQLGHQGDQQG